MVFESLHKLNINSVLFTLIHYMNEEIQYLLKFNINK